MQAPALVRQASSPRTASAATALDIALTEYHRRHGDVRFEVVDFRVTTSGIEFTVKARP